jgi:PHAX RNA-binding domain
LSEQPTGTPSLDEQDLARARKQEVADLIAEQLGEQDQLPRATIWRSVNVLGIENALTFLKRAQEIDAAGGIMTQDGSRRRTLGGVYFNLLHKEVPRKKHARIFPPAARPPQQQKQTPVGLAWSERGQALDEAEQERGIATTVKITIIGRPGRIIERGQCVVLSMQPAEKIPPLPAGLPLPPLAKVSTTHYTVYVSTKQWRKVAEAMKDQEDVLIAEGWPLLDQERGAIAVYISNITTKKIQQAKKQAQREAIERSSEESPK